MWISYIALFIRKDRNQTCQKKKSAAAFDTETSPKTNSPAAQPLEMKNETAIIVITGLRKIIPRKAGRKRKVLTAFPQGRPT